MSFKSDIEIKKERQLKTHSGNRRQTWHSRKRFWCPWAMTRQKSLPTILIACLTDQTVRSGDRAIINRPRR